MAENCRVFNGLSTVLACLTLLTGAAAYGQRGEGPINPAVPSGISVDAIIHKFASKEKEFKEARDRYTYRQDVTVETLDGDTIDGEYREVFDVTYDDRGRRVENVVYAPQSTLQRISMSPEDLSDIRNRLPFVLTSDEIGEYSIRYVGQQHVDEIDTYVFDIAPKEMEKGKRYFEGRIWVDNQDFQIVKTEGDTVPQIRKKNQENLFPKFVTYREQIDGRYWFPTYTRADDVLHFSYGLGGDVHIREIIKYTAYKRFGSESKIIYSGEVPPERQPKQQAPTSVPPR